MTISQSREEGKGLLFLSRQNGLLSPPPVFSRQQNKTEETDTQTELVLPLLQK